MSANIAIDKLKFSVFGRGYDDDRGNSGSGAKESTILNYSYTYAEIDITGRYIWLVGGSTLKKIDTYTWEEVDIGDIPSSCNYINHPKNVVNNYGFAYSANEAKGYVFDLTTNEILISGELDYTPSSPEDCILLNDTTMQFATLFQGRSTNSVKTLSLEDLSMSQMVNSNQRTFVGFTDDSHIYAYYPKEWFYQQNTIDLFTISGATVWNITQTNFDNVIRAGFTRNGKIYLPSYVNGLWVLGEYPQTPAPDVNTPSPSRICGKFDGIPDASHNTRLNVRYNTTRDIGLMCTAADGAYITDFDNVYKISEVNGLRALAVSDDMAVFSYTNGPKTEVVFF